LSVRGACALTGHGHQVARSNLWRICLAFGGASRGSPQVAHYLACDAWNQRGLGFKGPSQPCPTLGAVTPSTAAILVSKSNAVAAKATKRWRSISFGGQRRPRSMSLSDTCACKRLFTTERTYKRRSHLVALRSTKIQSADDIAAGRALMPTCATCNDSGWVRESHPERPLGWRGRRRLPGLQSIIGEAPRMPWVYSHIRQGLAPLALRNGPASSNIRSS
jgi:hypothetical protein